MAELFQYFALLDRIPPELGATLTEHGWEFSLAPARITVSKQGESLGDRAVLRDELERLLERSETEAKILHDRHLLITPSVARSPTEDRLADLSTMRLMSSSAISDIAGIFHDSGPATVTEGSTPAKSDRAAAATKPPEGSPAATELAALVEKGLPALELPANLWSIYIDEDERADFAKETAENLYAARIAYARRVGWVVAPELELIDFLDRLPEDPAVTPSKSATKALLQARINRVQSEADLVRKDVELKAELLRQQGKVTQLLGEVLRQAETWRGLAQTGKNFLVALTLFATAVTGFLAFLLFDKKLDAWAFPAAVFVLAVFAISPAVLLIIERPLKGIDQWMPGGKAKDEQTEAQNTASTQTDSKASPAAASAVK